MQRFISSFSVFLLFFVVINSLFYPLMADVLRLKSEHPDYYVVKKGDTLWDISAYFVNDPWHWPELWGDNTHIANPHLIYPGDKLTLSVVDGKPRLVVKPYFKKHPQGRIVPKNDAIPTVDLSLIRPYLIHNKIVDADWLAKQPIVLGGESASRHHVTDNIIYIKGPLSVGGKIGLYEEGRLFKRQQNGNSWDKRQY